MTEPADAPSTAPELPPPPAGEPENVLETFKAGADGTDNQNVHDAIGGRPRLNWSPVTDGGGRAPTDRAGEPSSFHFDLGGALARLGERQPDATADDMPPVAAAPAPAPAPIPPPPPVVEQPLPQRSPGVAASPTPAPPPPPAAPAPATADYTLPQRGPVAPSPESAPAPLEPLPRRGERPATAEPAASPSPVAPSPVASTPVAHRETTPGPYVTARRSVFDDAGSNPGTTMPPSVRPPATPIVPTSGAPAVAPIPSIPTLPSANAGPAIPTLPTLPTLPAAVPHASPMYTPPIESAPSTPDINAFRSAQLRQSRSQRKGKLFSRTLLALIVIGLAVGGALYFGRQYLFPTEWDASLTPVVDDIQNDRGVEFDHTVGLVEQPSADYALTIGRLVVDDRWLEQVPVWRALGLTTGEPTADGIAPALAAARLAVYDPDADRIYMSADADPDAAAADLRLALEAAFAAQHSSSAGDAEEEITTGFLGVSPPHEIVENAVANYLAQRESAQAEVAVDDASSPETPDSGSASALPIPIEYELAAIDELGEALLSAAGVDPATVHFGSPYPENFGTALDDRATPTSSGALQVGDRSLAPPTALGVDDWSLVWGSRLPQPTVDQLASVVVADSFRPIDRGGLICAIAVFETANPTDTASVLAAMQTWAGASAPSAQSTVSQLSDTRVQLSTCDPGAEAASSPQPGDVDALINRQLTRLAG